MEQMYLIEIFVDKVTIFATDEEETNDDKKLIIKINFGPKVQFIVKENQLAVNDKSDDIIECDESGRRQWTRTIRTGKSFLFPSYPDSVLNLLSKFPLEIAVWNDELTERENEIFVGVGNMHWDTKFFHMLKESSEPCKLHAPLSIKSKTTLWAECCCKPAGEIHFILRLSALGESIMTEFQQLLSDPESFVFRTNKAPSMFQCKRVEGDDPNFCMVGSLYETTTLEDPDVVSNAQKKIEICTELQSCGIGKKGDQYVCDHLGEDTDPKAKKKYPIDKIRMGDIIGPCGNTNCALAHKVRTYIRNLESYKGKATAAGITGTKPQITKKVCGACVCKDDRWHRDACPEEMESEKVKCMGCLGMTKAGHTCQDKRDKMYGTGFTPKTSDTKVAYMFSVTKFPNYKKGMFGQDTIVENCFTTQFDKFNNNISARQSVSFTQTGCSCNMAAVKKSISKPLDVKVVTSNIGTNNLWVYNVETNTNQKSTRASSSQGATTSGFNNPLTYNVGTSVGGNDNKRKLQVYHCSEVSEEKDCRCNPIKQSPPCRTIDCACLTEKENIASRKTHRPYCPSYRHKNNCPVTMMNEEEELKLEDDEDEVTPLPYGLPPIQLGPCPILGRPCTVSDGFARMYKNAQLPQLPYSYDDAGKVCCSKEYERIKKAIRDYVKNEKGHDFRCINKFNVDTERRCCDKEQVLKALEGRACCGSHKMAIQEKYEDEKKQP